MKVDWKRFLGCNILYVLLLSNVEIDISIWESVLVGISITLITSKEVE